MPKKSAGILVYRITKEQVEFLLLHPGGPFWKNKDAGAWSIPKGEFEEEDALEAAQREFSEETGQSIQGDFLELAPVKQKSGKTIYAWAVEGDLDVSVFRSNTFEMEWPPRSGKTQLFPEADKAEWFTPDMAKEKILAAQWPLLEETMEKLVNK